MRVIHDLFPTRRKSCPELKYISRHIVLSGFPALHNPLFSGQISSNDTVGDKGREFLSKLFSMELNSLPSLDFYLAIDAYF